MRDSDDEKNEPVPLSQAGFSKAHIERQLEKLLLSDVLDGRSTEKKLLIHLVLKSLDPNPQHLRASQINNVLSKKSLLGDSRARKEAGKLREHLDDYYASVKAEPGQIRFTIPSGQYVVYAPKASAASSPAGARTAEAPVVATILDPPNEAEVHHLGTFRGRIEGLDPDLRLWLVLTIPVGHHYPQCRVRRKNQPDWQEEARVGRIAWAADEGVPFDMHLVAAGDDADFAFFEYLKSGRDGFGRVMPSDCKILDTKRYIRRDIRTKA